ncbi:hypothetical protein ZEAMMB73_Zm00001d009697 [Zea mays]|uniref:Ubiquitin-like protease family profile domain-containing protein n=1 Tax=Zea mays TaxID=4577 RepID=A0A1D6FL75_MAIZE|nr:hypothetical protein ZEAMMB73_Zm00001d009697 [Zea mays]
MITLVQLLVFLAVPCSISSVTIAVKHAYLEKSISCRSCNLCGKEIIEAILDCADLVKGAKDKHLRVKRLVRIPTKDDMSHFRKKLAAILLSSDINKRKGCPLYKYDKEVDAGCSSDVQILDSPTNPKKRKLPCVSEENEVLMEDDDGPITQADLERWFVHDWDKRTPIKIPTDECTNEFLLSGLSTKDMPVTKADLIDVLCDYIMTIQDDTTLEMTWVRSFNPFKIEISVKDLQNVLRVNLYMTLKCFDMAVRLLAIKESHMSKDEMIKDKNIIWTCASGEWLVLVLMPWKFNGCYALFIIDHGKKHVTFIDFTPTEDWCKHMPYKGFAEAIIMASKKYKIAYNKKRSGWADDIFKWEHTIRSGLPLDLKGVNTSYFVLQAMVMWGSGRRMEFNRDTKILRRNFVIDLLSYEENSCRYAIPPNIQQRLISIAKKD